MSGDWRALLDRASALRRAGRVGEAIAAYEQLLSLNPDLPDSWYNLGLLQRLERRFEDALESYAQALDRGVSGAEEVHLNRAVILSDHLGQPDDAGKELHAALALNPSYVPALLNLGNLAEDLGRRDDARDAYGRALTAEPANMLALSRLAGVTTPAAPDEPLIGRLEQALGQPGIGDGERADLGFALTRLLDAVGRYDDAFAAASAANSASRHSFGANFRGYDRAAQEAMVDRLISAFATPVPRRRQSAERELIFICGMFRSGSTLCEQILASHPKVQAGGELDLIPAIVARDLQPYPAAAESLDADRIDQLRKAYRDGLKRRRLAGPVVTDKRPENFLHIGLIKTLFPSARIVHTRRNALDNLVSLYLLHLSPQMAYALDLDDSAHWLGQHDRLMAHWRSIYPDDIHELDYDALVADPRANIGELLEFCGLEWEESVLEFHTAANPVRTASVWQVRQPLHARSSERWRNYAKQLEQLAVRVQAT